MIGTYESGPDDKVRHAQECAVCNGECCDCHAWTYEQVLSEAFRLADRDGADSSLLMWLRTAQSAESNAGRLLALNKAREFASNQKVLALIDEGEELI